MPDYDTTYPRIQFRSSDELDRELAARSDEGRSIHAIAKRDLERYYAMVRRSLPAFSYGEASLLTDLMNGTIHQPYSVGLIWAEVSDALGEGYAEKWDVDGDALVEKLRRLTPFECMAIADAIERYWSGPYHQEGSAIDRLHEVGLLRDGQ